MTNNFTETYDFLVATIGSVSYGIIALDNWIRAFLLIPTKR